MKAKEAIKELHTTMKLKCSLEGRALIEVPCKLISWGKWVEQKSTVKYAQAAI